MRRPIEARDLLRGLARFAAELRRAADEVAREVSQPLEEAIRDSLGSAVWRLPEPRLPSADVLRARIEEALGAPLEEALRDIRETILSSSRGHAQAGGRVARERDEQD